MSESNGVHWLNIPYEPEVLEATEDHSVDVLREEAPAARTRLFGIPVVCVDALAPDEFLLLSELSDGRVHVVGPSVDIKIEQVCFLEGIEAEKLKALIREATKKKAPARKPRPAAKKKSVPLSDKRRNYERE